MAHLKPAVSEAILAPISAASQNQEVQYVEEQTSDKNSRRRRRSG